MLYIACVPLPNGIGMIEVTHSKLNYSVSHLVATWKSFIFSVVQLNEKLDKIELDTVGAEIID